MATFAEFLRWPIKTITRVVVFRPNLVLASWTAVGGGTPHVYQVSLPRFVFTDLITGGVYRRCVGLKENSDALTIQTSVANVEAVAGSWYWDESAGVLYAHSTTGSDPDTFTVYHAQVEIRVANRGVVLNLTDGDATTGIYHHPWLTSDVPNESSELSGYFFGQKRAAGSQITVLNEAYVWYRLLATDGDYWWTSTPVRFYVGGSYNGQDLAWSQYAADLTLEIVDAACDDVQAVFELKPLVRALDVTVPPTPFFESEYPNLGEGVRGKKKPIGYGRTTMRPYLTDTSGLGIWTVADAAHQSLLSLVSVNAINKTSGVRTTLSLGTDYTQDLTACTLTIVNATYTWQSSDVEVEVIGKPSTAAVGPLTPIGPAIDAFAEVAWDLLVTFAGVDPGDIDLAAFQTMQADASEELSVWLLEPRVLNEIFSAPAELPENVSLEGSVLATIQQTQSGLWTGFIWTPGYDATALAHLHATDFALFKPEPKLETIYQGARVDYNVNLSTGEWPGESTTVPAVASLASTVATLERYTFLRSASDAQILAQRLLLLTSTRSLEVEFEEVGSLLAQHLAGAKVLVTRDPAPAASGSFSAKPFEIIRLDRQPSLAIAGRLSDLRGIGRGIGQWKDDSAANWSALSADDRLTNPGFWTDDTGRPDPADPTSAGASLWW